MTKTINTISVLSIVTLLLPIMAYAGHNGAVVDHETGECGATTFSATIADPSGTHKVSNMFLVLDVDGDVTTANIPTDGATTTVTVGPFTESTVIQYRVFGGGERDYDQPAWNSGDLGTYIANNGDAWTLAGVDDPNPFVTWNSLVVNGCEPEPEEESTSGVGGAQPWCSGPTAPGWNVSLPGGGCQGQSYSFGAPTVPEDIGGIGGPVIMPTYFDPGETVTVGGVSHTCPLSYAPFGCVVK